MVGFVRSSSKCLDIKKYFEIRFHKIKIKISSSNSYAHTFSVWKYQQRSLKRKIHKFTIPIDTCSVKL